MLKSFFRILLPRSVRKHRICAGPLRGSSIFTSWYDYPAAILGRTERQLTEWFASNVKASETWLDIGAHYGYTAIALSRLVGPAGRVFAFEPMLSTAGYLAKTRILNHLTQLTILPLGLVAANRFELRRLPAIRGMIDSAQKSSQWSETFLTSQFDLLWPQICGNCDFFHGVKIDVQGMELEVLYGMKKNLDLFSPKVVVEIHSGVDRTNLLNFFANLGYDHGLPIEPVKGEIESQYVDNHSYVFQKVLRDQ